MHAALSLSRRRALAGLSSIALAPALVAKETPGVTISVFSSHLQHLDYEALCRKAADMGFDGVDLTVRPGGHVEPDRVGDDLPRAVEAIRKTGLRTELITTAVSDPNNAVDRRVLEVAARLGVKQYRMAWFLREEGESPAEKIPFYRSVFDELSHLNKELGLVGSYQNHAGNKFVGASIWELWLMFQDADHQYMGVQYDLRHAVVEGWFSWRAGLNLIHPIIKSVVLKDFNWMNKPDRAAIRNVPLGQGVIPFDEFVSELSAYGVRPPISLHAPYELNDNIVGNLTRDLRVARNILGNL